MTNDLIVLHYNEIALKLGHRSMFVRQLTQNVRAALRDLPVAEVRAHAARLFVELGEADVEQVLRRLRVIPGLANCVVAATLPVSMEALEEATIALLDRWRPSGTFKVSVRRSEKRFEFTSPEVGARLGALIVERTGAKVDLSDPDETVRVIILFDAIYLGVRRTECAGGLPVSTGGRVGLLLSGGIDSPVAGFRMQRRGCRLHGIHFHSVPYLNATSQEKARQLAALLARGQQGMKLSMVPFGDAQSEIVRFVPRPLRVVLYRRFMMRIACSLARSHKIAALATGESLGQVASQTLANMTVIENASSLPVLRPLVGMDKREITDYAIREDTFEISIQPDQDCCTLFVPKHPATHASERDVLAAESLVEGERLVAEAVAATETEVIQADWKTS